MGGWILVTGGAKGLGRAICLELAGRGHSIVIHYRTSQKEAASTAQLCADYSVKVEVLQGDLETPASTRVFLEEYLARFPSTKGLVNNVGNYLIAPLTETSESDWLSLFQTNVHAPFSLIKALLPSLKKERGQIVNIGTSGLLTTLTHREAGAYALTKMTLWHLTRHLARELAAEHVRVNMISPGVLETSVDFPEIPMGRVATLEETAKWVGLLFEEENNYVTGQNIEIAGGLGL